MLKSTHSPRFLRYVFPVTLVPILLLLLVPASNAAPITNGGPGGFAASNPNGASNMVLWLKADAINQSDSTPVAAWVDSSFYGYHAVAATGTEPTFIASAVGVNNQPVVRFDGTEYLDLVSASAGMLANVGGATLFQVVRTNDTTNTQRSVSLSTNQGAGDFLRASLNLFDNNSGLLADTGAAQFSTSGRRLDGDTNQKVRGGTVTAGSYYVHGGSLDYANSDISLFVNSAVLTTSASFQTDGNTSNTLAITNRIGALGGAAPSAQLNGDLAEVLVFNKTLNNAERILVDNHLSSKYALAMAANDHYLGDTPGNNHYDFGVFGIGRVGAGHEVTTAGAHGFGFETISLDNGEWMLAGHDGTANAIVSFEAGPDIAGSRWNRVWYLDKTGTLDATLAFDFEDSGLGTPAGTNSYHLLFSADGDFSDGWEILDVTSLISSGTVTFDVANADLLDGFYTLGLNISLVPEPGAWTMFALGSVALAWQTRRRREKA